MKVKIKQTTFLEKNESRDPIKHAHIWIQFQDSNLWRKQEKKLNFTFLKILGLVVFSFLFFFIFLI